MLTAISICENSEVSSSKLVGAYKNRLGKTDMVYSRRAWIYFTPDGVPLVVRTVYIATCTHQVTEECVSVDRLGALPVKLGALLVQRLAAVGLRPQRAQLLPGRVGKLLQRRVLRNLVALLSVRRLQTVLKLPPVVWARYSQA